MRQLENFTTIIISEEKSDKNMQNPCSKQNPQGCSKFKTAKIFSLYCNVVLCCVMNEESIIKLSSIFPLTQHPAQLLS